MAEPDANSLYDRLDSTLNSIFGPINRGMASIGLQPQSPIDNIMLAMSMMGTKAGGPGRLSTKMNENINSATGRSEYWSPPFKPGTMMGTTRTPPELRHIRSEFPPVLFDRSGQFNRHPTLGGQFGGAPSLRINTFNPRVEQAMASMPGNTRTLTPSNNLTAEQQYNLAIIRQLLGGN